MAGFHDSGILPELPEEPSCQQVQRDWPVEPQPFETICAFGMAYFEALDAMLRDGASLAFAEEGHFANPMAAVAYSGTSLSPMSSGQPLGSPAQPGLPFFDNARPLAQDVAEAWQPREATEVVDIAITAVPLSDSGVFLFAVLVGGAMLACRRMGHLPRPALAPHPGPARRALRSVD